MENKLDIEKLYQALERIMSDRFNVEVKITAKKKCGRPKKK